MNARIKGLVTIAALVAAAACGDASNVLAPDGAALAKGGGTVAMTFGFMQDYDDNLASAPVWAGGGTGVVDFGGTLVTSTPCFDVTAANETTARGVVVTVTATPTGAACIQVITDNHYTGRLAGMPAGTHKLKIMHQVGTARPTLAYDGMVTVR